MPKYLVEFEILDANNNLIEKTDIEVNLDKVATNDCIGKEVQRNTNVKYPNNDYRLKMIGYKKI